MLESIFAPHREEKVWGSVVHLFTSDSASLSVLSVNKESWCSIHRHLERVNHFIVLSGSLSVLYFGDQEDPTDDPQMAYFLTSGKTHTVNAGVWHQFYVEEAGSVIEVYWPSKPGHRVQHSDIERRTLGGCDD